MSRLRTMMAAAAVGLFSLGTAVPVEAGENWSNWRGPNYNGSTTGNPPVEFSPTENVKWRTELPGPSAATPIIHDNHVFLSSADPNTEKLWAIALDRATGEILWREEAGTGYQQDGRSNYASPSPVTDGERVIFFFGTGDLVAFNFEGERLWSRNIQADYGPFAFLWTFSTSPLLWEGKLYMQVLQRDVPVSGRGRADVFNESYLLALNPEDGEEIFRVVRDSDARLESREAFSTPIPFEHEGRKELLIAGGDDLTGHDPETGEELWRWGTWNPTRITHWRLVPSPVSGSGVIIAAAPKGDPVYAVRAGGEGDLSDDWLAWVSEERGPVSTDVPTPAYHDGNFYVVRDVGRQRAITAVDAESGDVHWSANIPGPAMTWGSPTVVADRIYFQNLLGEVFVYSTEGELLHRVEMAANQNEIRSTISVAGDQLFIRNNTHLYCIE